MLFGIMPAERPSSRIVDAKLWSVICSCTPAEHNFRYSASTRAISGELSRTCHHFLLLVHGLHTSSHDNNISPFFFLPGTGTTAFAARRLHHCILVSPGFFVSALFSSFRRHVLLFIHLWPVCRATRAECIRPCFRVSSTEN